MPTSVKYVQTSHSY